MYTAEKVVVIKKDSPSKWKIKTTEGFDIIVQYRYGFIIIMVNDETLHKSRLTTDITDSKMSWEDFLDYQKEHLPREMIDFSLIKNKNDESKQKE